MKTLSINILDSAFSAFLSFVLTFLILNYFIDRPYSIIISISLSVPIFILSYNKLKKSANIKSLDKLKRKAVENVFYSLCLMEKNSLVALFEKALLRLDYKTIRRKNGVFIDEKKVAIFPIFTFDGITKTDVVRVFNSVPVHFKAYIFGESISQDLQSFIIRFDNRIEFIGIEKVYNLLKQTSCLPKESSLLKNKKFFENGFFKAVFNKRNSKKFLSFGSLFLLMSYFVPIKIYYVISGCVFLTFSLFCRLYGKTKP